MICFNNFQGFARTTRLTFITMEKISDQELVGLAVSGDAAAFARLIERHYDMIFRVAFKWCGNRDDAEDIAQDVCVKLGSVIRGFKGDAAFTSWLYRITLNAVRDFQRAARRRTDNIAALSVVMQKDHRPDPATEMTQGQMWRKVRQLPPKQRDAMLLIYAEDLSHAEAAMILQCAESTVSWHVHEAKKRLKQEMQD